MRGNVSNYHSRLALRRADAGPRRHRRARSTTSTAASALEPGRRVARRRRRARRLALVRVRRRRLGQPARRTAGSTSTCSPTATTTPRRCRRSTRVSGRPPVLPRWALGNWWSRYHRYSADSYLRAARPVRRRGHAVLGRGDRHGLAPGRLGARALRPRLDRLQLGARRCSPTPTAFLAELHDRGLRVTLNVHPADGVRAFEDAYPAMAEALGRDPAADEPIAFDITDRDVPRRLLRGAAPPARGRRASTSGGSTGSRARTRAIAGHRPAVDAQPLPLPRLRRATAGGR